MHRKFSPALLSLSLIALAPAALAQNIVTNPGFETGTSPWQGAKTGGIFLFTDAVASRAHTGTRSFSFAPGSTPGSGTIQQTLPTVGLQAYILDFWFRDENTSFPTGTDPVTVSWDGTLLATLDLQKDSTHHEFTFAVQASGPSTVLQFGSPVMTAGSSGTWRINLDDVSVTADAGAATTPEPGSFALLVGAGVSGMGLLRRKRHK